MLIVDKGGEKFTKIVRWVREIGGEKYDKERGSIKILSTQVGGASSLTCMVHLNVHLICLLA